MSSSSYCVCISLHGHIISTDWLALGSPLRSRSEWSLLKLYSDVADVTYHRIVGAILLYLLIAVAFGTLFIFVGLPFPDAFKGITFEDNPGLANSVFYLSFVTLTSTGYGDIVPVHPKSLQHRKRYWSALSSHVVGKACDFSNCTSAGPINKSRGQPTPVVDRIDADQRFSLL